MTIHDINMDPVRPGFINGGNFFAQLGKISGQDGWGDFKHIRTSFKKDCPRYNKGHLKSTPKIKRAPA